MSAAEKLDSLDVSDPELFAISGFEGVGISTDDAKLFAAIFNALPEIIAVLKAAETMRDELDTWEPTERTRAALINFLSALDEKLGDVT